MPSIAQEQPSTLLQPANGQPTVAAPARPVHRMPKPRRMTLERWRDWKSTDGWKYDWNNGIITKSKEMVTKEPRYILQNLLDAFYAKGLNRAGGLMPEAEMSYDGHRYRVPHLAYFSKIQTLADAEGKQERSVPLFAIEVISDNDIGKSIENKLWEYFENGVQVVLPPRYSQRSR